MKLKFGKQLIEPAVRRLRALHDVAFDSAWFEEAADRDAYYMAQSRAHARRPGDHHPPSAALRHHNNPPARDGARVR